MTEVSRRNARNRRTGARWQSDLRDGLREAGLYVERLVLTGREDEGDLVVTALFTGPDGSGQEHVIIEAKSGTMHPAEFVREASREAKHFAEHRNLDPGSVRGIAVVKQRGKGWRDAYVLTTVQDYFGLRP